MITISEAAQKKIRALMEKSETPVKGLLVGAEAVSPLKVNYRLAFIAQDQELPESTVVPFEGFEVYIDAEHMPYVEGASIDFVESLMGSGFKVERPKELPSHLSGPMLDKVQAVLEGQINPYVASHGGHIALIDIKDKVVYVQLEGGCQGCGMADLTLKQGIETAIKEAVPEVEAVYDVTDHAGGENPYYQPSRG